MGEFFDDSGYPGLAGAVGNQMRDGGISGFTPQEFDKRLDTLAASIESRFGGELGSVGFSCLEEDLDEVFGYFAQVVRKPAFDEGRLGLWKLLATDAIGRRKDNPDRMASIAFDYFLQGKNSPYARAASKESVDAIEVSTLRAFHDRFVVPGRAKLALTGSISRERAEALVNQYFGDWGGE